MSIESATYIYGLYDPRDNALRYIGKSACLLQRLYAHIRDAKYKPRWNMHRAHWLAQLINLRLMPRMQILSSCRGDGSEEERYFIWLARAAGMRLVNGTDGGDGSKGMIHSESTRKIIGGKVKASWKRRSPEQKNERSELTRQTFAGTKLSQAHRAKIGAKSRGRSPSLEIRKQMSESAKLRWLNMSEQQRSDYSEIFSKRFKGIRKPRAQVEKMIAKKTGRPRSVETCRKVATALRGRKQSPEMKARVRASMEANNAWEKGAQNQRALAGLESHVRELYQSGMSVQKIGTELSVSPQTAWRTLKRIGVTFRGRGKRASG